MSLRPLQQLSKSLSSVRDPQQLGQLVGTIADCLDAVIKQCVSVYRGLQDDSSKASFLKRFRTGLLDSKVAKSYVDKIMTTVNQCCLEGFKFCNLDPHLNKLAQNQKSTEVSEVVERDGWDDGGDGEEGDDEGDDAVNAHDNADTAGALKVKRSRVKGKKKPGNTRNVKKKVVVVVQDSHPPDIDEEDSAPPAIGFSPSFRSPDSLLALKSARSSSMTLPFLDRLFELFYSETLLWNKGNNICVDLLLHIGACHDKVLQANQRQPCGSVAQVFREAIPAWNEFETERGWIRSDELKSQQKRNFEEAMTSDQRWAITTVEVKGAVGLVLEALLAYFPGLCFTNISHHDEKTSDEIRNNRAMAMLPSHHSKRMFSLLEKSGYITMDGYPPEFWETSAVCLSSNDSAMDVSRVQHSVQEHRFRVWSETEEDCFHFENPPPIWGLNANTSWVKISSSMWGEIGPRRYLLLPLPPPLQKQ
jgi:hypothetical protein